LDSVTAKLTCLQCYTHCIMTLTSETAALAEPRPSLRARKKLATRRSLRRIALDLVSERGFAHVTVEDIAEAADVSPRTFFNYFPSKEAALFGADPERTGILRRRLVEELPGESAMEVLRVVLVDQARAFTDELRELGGDPGDWLRRMKAAHSDPHLKAARGAHAAMVESVVAGALAERLGTDPERDPYPVVLASAAMGMMRAIISFWPCVGGTVPLDQLIEAAYQALAAGFPEDSALRGIAATTEGASPSPAVADVPARNRRKDDSR
jgi:AcrR family transcriptional regulator